MTPERPPAPDATEVSVVGIGADGWAGLGPSARAVLGRARVRAALESYFAPA